MDSPAPANSVAETFETETFENPVSPDTAQLGPTAIVVAQPDGELHPSVWNLRQKSLFSALLKTLVLSFQLPLLLLEPFPASLPARRGERDLPRPPSRKRS